MHYPGLFKNRCGVYCYRLFFPPFFRRLGAHLELERLTHHWSWVSLLVGKPLNSSCNHASSSELSGA